MSQVRTRVGYHYYPDDHHFTESDLAQWLPLLKALGASWITLHASPSVAVPEHFVRALIDAGIQPVIHIPSPVAGPSLKDLSPLFACYAQWGVRHVVLFDRPNRKASWGAASWSRHGLVERFLDRAIPVFQAMQAAGLQPVLPPLEPGGDYWDTAFLEGALQGLVRRGHHNLLQDLVLGSYAWTYGKPLEWGQGGPARWPQAKPYHTPEGCQDQIGFRIFDWYSAISLRAVGRALPLLVIAGGALPEAKESAFSGADQHTEQNLSIARLLESDAIPANVLGFIFYLLASDPEDPENAQAWFPSLDRPLPVVEAFRRHFNREAEISPAPATKPHHHYILLPRCAYSDFKALWSDLVGLVSTTRATVGFSVEEAALARRVTMVNGRRGFPESVYRQLQEAGCNVERL